MRCQAQQMFVAGDQQVSVTARSEKQELLVVVVTAAWQWIVFLAAGIAERGLLLVARQQGLLCGGIQGEFGIGADALQFGQAGRVGKALPLPADEPCGQHLRVRVGKM